MNARITLATPSEDERRLDLEKLGGATFLLFRRPTHYRQSKAWLRDWLENAIGFRQFALYYDEHGAPVAYVAWAFLAPDVKLRLRNDPRSTLHISEWTEAQTPCVIDFIAKPRFLREVIAHAAQHVFTDFSSVDYLRRSPDGAVRRVGRLRNRFCRKDDSSGSV